MASEFDIELRLNTKSHMELEDTVEQEYFG
jgi:hypothetical protein